jgi:hypothetical protein
MPTINKIIAPTINAPIVAGFAFLLITYSLCVDDSQVSGKY